MIADVQIMRTAAMLLVGLATSGAHAAPITNAAAQLSVAVTGSTIVDKAASRRCWRQNGKRYCASYGRSRRHADRNAAKYEEFIADKRPFGTSSWWDQMLRENRAGNPGGGGRD